ncbi:MAG TPA: acylphosphatase, partial [Candidatus Caldiarchaeum subterraneum]|nr:acylphosphatase [Candidatus Caldarchaeum subterraneum]
MKVTVRVFGNVQAVGYRALVKSIARSMGVRGLVRNLEDGSVEIFADAPEDILGRFLRYIEVKGRPEDILSLHVERV